MNCIIGCDINIALLVNWATSRLQIDSKFLTGAHAAGAAVKCFELPNEKSRQQNS